VLHHRASSVPVPIRRSLRQGCNMTLSRRRRRRHIRTLARTYGHDGDGGKDEDDCQRMGRLGHGAPEARSIVLAALCSELDDRSRWLEEEIGGGRRNEVLPPWRRLLERRQVATTTERGLPSEAACSDCFWLPWDAARPFISEKTTYDDDLRRRGRGLRAYMLLELERAGVETA
jgi:hypothetical protein